MYRGFPGMLASLLLPVTSEEVIKEPSIQDNTPQPHYVFIHGANQTRKSWNYIVEKLDPQSYTLLEYDTNKKFFDNLEKLHDEISHLENIIYLGHSLGGIYAVHLYERMKDKVVGGITISTPHGGSRTADYVKYMVPSYNLFKEIGPKSPPISEALKIKISVPWYQIVTTRGNVPWHGADNDGVVTVPSMTVRNDMFYHTIEENHYEILACDETVEFIKSFSAKILDK